MVIVARFTNMVEADFAKSELEDVGIPVFIPDASAAWGFGNTTGGIDVWVSARDVEAAKQLLGRR